MKKNFFVVGMAVMLLTFAVVFVGCSSSAPFVYDTTVPPEQSSTLIINGCQVYKFNGETMSLKNWNAGVGEKTVVIPAGTHTLEVWASQSSEGGTKLEYGKVEITHTFLPGKIYLVTALIEGNSLKAQITNVPSVPSGDLVPNPESPDASPFEGVWASNDGSQWVFAGNEWAIKVKGAENTRGSFTYNENTVTVNIYYQFFMGKWQSGSFSYKFTYDGTTLKYGNTVLKRAE